MDRTCINFVESTNAINRVRIFDGDACYSATGMTGGIQNLSLDNGCELVGTVLHEHLHSLGFVHTIMRSDRDNYVTVDLTNVDPSTEVQFAKISARNSTNYTPYEYGSVLHYTANVFTTTKGNLSIIPKNKNYMYTMGNRLISFYDIKMVNDYYGCSAKCAKKAVKCTNGGVPNPRNCSICNCPAGYGGALCDQRPTGCGSLLKATSNWQTATISVGESTNDYDERDSYSQCVHWIQADPLSSIQLKITNIFNSPCDFGCPNSGLQIKSDYDQKMTGPIYCCEKDLNQTIWSKVNPLPIIFFNRLFYSNFTIQFRADKCSNRAGAWCELNRWICSVPKPYSWSEVKYKCGLKCGFCGKAASPCIDQKKNCNVFKKKGSCPKDLMLAEAKCAKSCNLCQHPI